MVELLWGDHFYIVHERQAGDKLRVLQSRAAMPLQMFDLDGVEIRRRRIQHQKMVKAEKERQYETENQERHRRRLIWESDHPVQAAFQASDGLRTRRILRELEQIGSLGRVAAQLLRAQKASGRAKEYRGDYVAYAYRRKGESLERLCELLSHQQELVWGWGTDVEMERGPRHVFYIDLPRGQASFHSFERYGGPDYPREWDGRHASESNIIDFGERLYAERRSFDPKQING